MSEDRDEATGQFAPSTENLFGREYDEVNAGFKPMPEPAKDGPTEFATPREAADALIAERGVDADELIEVSYQSTATGEKTDQKETVSLERAASDLSTYHNLIDEHAGKSVSAEFAAEVDRMRADAIKANPKLAEHYGIEPPADDGEKTEETTIKRADAKNDQVEPATAEAIDSIDGLHPETAKALKIPQVRQALEEQFSQADRVRESYSAALSNANAFAQAAFMEAVPELAGLPTDQLEQGLALLAQVDPPRFNAAMNVLNRVSTIQQAQQQEQQHRAYAAHHQFEAYAKAEDSKFRAMYGDDKGKIKGAAAEVVSYLEDLGIGQDRLVQLLRTDPVIRSAEGQKILADAARYQAMKKAIPKAAPKTLPPVQRPGVSQHGRGNDSSSKIQSLERQLATATGHKAARLSADLLAARRSANSRG